MTTIKQIDFTKEDLGSSEYALAKQIDMENINVLTSAEMEIVNGEYTGYLILNIQKFGDVIYGGD